MMSQEQKFLNDQDAIEMMYIEAVTDDRDLGVEDDIDGDYDWDSPDDDSEMYGDDVEQIPEFDE